VQPQTKHSVLPMPQTKHSVLPMPQTKHPVLPMAQTKHSVLPMPQTKHSVLPMTQTKHSVLPMPQTKHFSTNKLFTHDPTDFQSCRLAITIIMSAGSTFLTLNTTLEMHIISKIT